jgi:hypothetical protein
MQSALSEISLNRFFDVMNIVPEGKYYCNCRPLTATQMCFSSEYFSIDLFQELAMFNLLVKISKITESLIS